jgi:cellulose synthase/poly-beta-1,6-N-acetylglucosamine synthase-like glycosyltransferase
MTTTYVVFLVAALLVLAVPAVLACVYLLAATLLSGRSERPPRSSRLMRFDVMVPAHDEAAVIARCVASLRRLDWPAECFRVIVVADNCTDVTAAIAAAAGGQVIERRDESRRGKGYALQYAFEASRVERWASAVVVVDADSEAADNLLEAFAVRIERGAHAVQADYGVLNPWVSWRTRLMAIAHSAFHIMRSRARERLGLSCGIRGNGWCVTHALLQSVPYQAFSLTEDLEYGIDLGLAGYRVHYADEASVRGEMVSSAHSAKKQRRRWEDGRFSLLRLRAFTLLRVGLRRRNRVCVDLALDLLVPPLSYIVVNVTVLLLLAAAACRWNTLFLGWLWAGTACGAVLLLYVLRAWQLSGVGARGLLDLACAPVFLVWKLVVMSSRHETREWVRTDRERP